MIKLIRLALPLFFLFIVSCENGLARRELAEKLRAYNEIAPQTIAEYQIKAESHLKQICSVLADTRKKVCELVKIKIVPTSQFYFGTMDVNRGLMLLETVAFVEISDGTLKSTIAHEVGHRISRYEKGFWAFTFRSGLEEEIEADKFEASITSKETALSFFYTYSRLRVRLGFMKNEKDFLEKDRIAARINALRSL